MLRSQPPSKPHTRSKRKHKPPWTDPETRVTDATATRFTLGPKAHEAAAYADLFRTLSLIDWYFSVKRRAVRKGGAR